MFIDCMHRVSSRCYNRLLHTNIVPNVIQSHWMSGTKWNAIQMRPNVAGRFSDFATNSRAMTSMSMLYSLSLQCVHAEQRGNGVAADSLSCASMFSGETQWWEAAFDQKVEGDQYIAGPPSQKLGGLVSPGPCGCCAYVRRYKWRFIYECWIST